MKKFLSLLLALTLVLSLVVVPARAAAETMTSLSMEQTKTLEVGASTGNELTVSGTPTYGNPATAVPSDATVSYTWSSSDNTVATVAKKSGSDNVGVITALKKSTSAITITCVVTYTWNAGAATSVSANDAREAGSAAQTLNCTLTVNNTVADTAFKNAITAVNYSGRNYLSSGSVNAYKFTGDTDTWTATVSSEAASTYGNIAAIFNSSNGEITVTATKDGSTVTAKFPCTLTPVTVTVTAKPSTVVANGKSALYADAPSIPGVTPSYQWKKDGTAIKDAVSPSYKATPGSYTCEVTYKLSDVDSKMVPSSSQTVSLDNKTYSFTGVPATTLSLAKGNVDTERVKGIKLKYGTGSSAAEATNVIYKYQSSNQSVVTVGTDGKLTAVGSGNATITVSAKEKVGKNELVDYRGYPYSATFTVSVTSLDVTLNSVYNGSGSTPIAKSLLDSCAKDVIARSLPSTAASSITINSMTVKSGSVNALYGAFAPASGAVTTGLTYTAPTSYIGKASVTLTVDTNKGFFDVTYIIPVIPIYNQTFEAQYPQAVSSIGNTYNYTVTAPTGYDRIALITKGTTPTTAQLTTMPAYNSTSITLNSNDFNTSTGKCTLYVMAWNSNWTSNYYSTGKYYYGPLEVYQKNYNINYNGVAGETVQFAQSDFTDFMNEVAEARGDASKTKSYPYVTFDYVTFSLPTTAQGTLYYGGTAMSTSNSSGAFNTRTKVTNLDSVTFVPNAKTTAKTITLNFTLYATRYSSSSTSHGTTVPYSGTVVINLVREDIKYTVSQGDSVRFDESDFLSYLLSTKGYTSNYTIDYVTFDQSAVSAVNEGSLYTYYNGYNYGGSVKTTDKFYYNATASQNALSDVAFLASRYAKTGETVYIPFTIYARYGTTGTGTRQLTGTVAIKIGQTMNFIDVKTTDYFYNSVKWAVGKNITNGTSSTTFSPYKSCTRAEIVTFLWRAAGSPEPTITRNPFRDVNAVTHSSYYKAILWASQKGITSGTSATAFSPDQVCTRAQIVTFLYRYAGKPSGYYSNPFKDVGATSEASYYNAILWAVGKGITTGTSATTFSPYASCNRAEAVTFLYRYTNGL